MNILITGSSGLIGSALVQSLPGQGHQVYRLLRKQTSPHDLYWNPDEGFIAPEVFAGIDAVIHLAGENIGERNWNADRKARILHSRVRGTRLLAEHLAASHIKPSVFISASGAGIYGERGDTWVDETFAPGENFLAEVARQWEEAANPAAEAGIRIVHIRLGVVLCRKGGALQKMLLPFKLGLGGRLGNGRQYLSWVSLPDVVSMIQFVLTHDELCGPVNLVSPHPVTNTEFTRALGKTLHRPALLWVPAFSLRLMFGEQANELLLMSTRVTPKKLLEAGYSFIYPELGEALQAIFQNAD